MNYQVSVASLSFIALHIHILISETTTTLPLDKTLPISSWNVSGGPLNLICVHFCVIFLYLFWHSFHMSKPGESALFHFYTATLSCSYSLLPLLHSGYGLSCTLFEFVGSQTKLRNGSNALNKRDKPRRVSFNQQPSRLIDCSRSVVEVKSLYVYLRFSIS